MYVDVGHLQKKMDEMTPNDREKIRRSQAIRFNWRNSPRIEHGASPGLPNTGPKTMEISLRTGRLIKLGRFHQFNIYGGLLCGLPLDPENDLLQAIDIANIQFPHHKILPVVLEPRFHSGRLVQMEKGQGVLVPWLGLPSVCTIAEFDSGEPTRNSQEIGSSVLVIWFQDHYGLPEDKITMEQLSTMDWETHAQNWTP